MQISKKTVYRAGMIILGNLTYSMGVNLMITPIHLYSGGFTGITQLIRTFLIDFLHVPQIGGIDYMGLIYFLLNLPFFIMAYKIIAPFQWGSTTGISPVSGGGRRRLGASSRGPRVRAV